MGKPAALVVCALVYQNRVMSSVDLCALRQKKYQFHHVKAKLFLYKKLQTRRLSSVFTNQQKNRTSLVLTLNMSGGMEAHNFAL